MAAGAWPARSPPLPHRSVSPRPGTPVSLTDPFSSRLGARVKRLAGVLLFVVVVGLLWMRQGAHTGTDTRPPALSPDPDTAYRPLRLASGYTGLEGPCDPWGGKATRQRVDVVGAVGVVSAADEEGHGRRAHWREHWGRWPGSVRARLVLRFVVCAPTEGGEWARLETEAQAHGDLLVLGCRQGAEGLDDRARGVWAWGAELCGAFYVVLVHGHTYLHTPLVKYHMLMRQPTGLFAAAHTHPPPGPNTTSGNAALLQHTVGGMAMLSRDLALALAAGRGLQGMHVDRVGLGVVGGDGPCVEGAAAWHGAGAEIMDRLQENVLARTKLCTGLEGPQDM